MLERELELLEPMVREAGEMLLAEGSRPEGPRGAGDKAEIDVEIEDFLKEALGREFRQDAILCEEGDDREGQSGRTFVLDPHDGTSDFLKGHRETSIALGLVDRGELVLGMVYAPFSTELTGDDGTFVIWAKGHALRCNGEEVDLPPAPTELGEESKVLISRKVKGAKLEENKKYLSPAEPTACASIATRCALVAVGRADAALTVRHSLSDWDIAAGQALLQGAGGDLVGPGGVKILWPGQRAQPNDILGYFAARDVGLATKISEAFRPITG